MARINLIQTNFTAGEFSPRLKGRVDVAKYSNAAQEILNFVMMPHGGLTRRMGSRFIHEVSDSTKKSRLVPFEFSSIQAYQIEFSENKIRFFKDEGIVTLTAQNITDATNATPIVVTCAGHGYSNGDWVVVTGVLGNLAANGTWQVANVTANTFELAGSVGDGNYTSGGTVAKIYEVVSTYTETQLFDLYFTQSADILYITHPSHPPRKLSRTAHTSWTLTDIAFKDGPYNDENKDTAKTLSISATAVGAGRTITAVGHSPFAASDVGRFVSIKEGSLRGVAKITAFTDAQNVTAEVIHAFSSTSAQSLWRLGAFSTASGYPACVVFFEERLVFANTVTQPQTFWMSVSADYENMAPTDPATAEVNDDSAVTYTIASNKVNSIRWMDAGVVLLLGTIGAEWQAKAGTTSEPITPTNIQVTQQTTYGSRAVIPRRIGTAVLFVQRSGRKLRELLYNFEIDGFVAKDLSLLAEHLPREGDYLVDGAWQQEPDSVYWMLRADGALIGMTYLRDQDVIGWHRHRMGGEFGDGGAPVVESVSVIPNPEGTADQVWLIVKRTINGSTKRYIELLEDQFNPSSETDKEGMFYMDCGLIYDGAAATVISGLRHLEGQTVSVVADGSVIPDKVVTGGKVTLENEAELVYIGLNAQARVHTLPPEGGGNSGTSQAKVKRIHKMGVRFHDTLGGKIGPALDELDLVYFREADDPMDSSPPLFTGDKIVDFDGDYETQADFYIVQDQPYPMTILATFPESVTYQ